MPLRLPALAARHDTATLDVGTRPPSPLTVGVGALLAGSAFMGFR